MKFGVFMFPTDYSIDPVTLGKAAEAHGFESLFFPEHTHIPTSRESPWGGGAELPPEYWHAFDPFVALGAVASATERILLGTGICLVIEHDPIVLAKKVASLDFLSNGRFLFGIGGGWNREEMRNHGTEPTTRWHLLRERMEAMQAIWTQDEAEYHGELVDFDPIWSWPKPVQKPYPPVLVGGDGPNTLKRVVRYGDGWIPIGGRTRTDFSDRIAELNQLAAEAGRGPIPVTIFGSPMDPDVIEKHIAVGVDRIVFQLPSKPADTILPLLERQAQLAQQFQ